MIEVAVMHVRSLVGPIHGGVYGASPMLTNDGLGADDLGLADVKHSDVPLPTVDELLYQVLTEKSRTTSHQSPCLSMIWHLSVKTGLDLPPSCSFCWTSPLTERSQALAQGGASETPCAE